MIPGTHDVRLTRHAASRMRQRGVPTRVLDLLIANADRSIQAGDGCETLRLSAQAATALVIGGAAPDDVARAMRVAAVMGRDGIASILRPARGHRGRCYRRQMPTRAGTGHNW